MTSIVNREVLVDLAGSNLVSEITETSQLPTVGRDSSSTRTISAEIREMSIRDVTSPLKLSEKSPLQKATSSVPSKIICCCSGTAAVTALAFEPVSTVFCGSGEGRATPTLSNG
eukprot:3314150-Pleurochrysis_carterae.AAC.3